MAHETQFDLGMEDLRSAVNALIINIVWFARQRKTYLEKAYQRFLDGNPNHKTTLGTFGFTFDTLDEHLYNYAR